MRQPIPNQCRDFPCHAMPCQCHAMPCPAVRYLDVMRGQHGQPPQTPLPDIIAHLEAASRSGSGVAGSSRGGSGQHAVAAEDGQQQVHQAQRAQQCPCTIIYTHRREDADHVAAALRKRGFACAGGVGAQPACLSQLRPLGDATQSCRLAKLTGCPFPFRLSSLPCRPAGRHAQRRAAGLAGGAADRDRCHCGLWHGSGQSGQVGGIAAAMPCHAVPCCVLPCHARATCPALPCLE